MPRPAPGTTITEPSVTAAVKAAAAGEVWEYPDPACPGLTLRVRGRVTWTFRGPRLGGKNRRFVIGDHTTMPKKARRRAAEVRRLVQQGFDPRPTIVAWLTGVAVEAQAEQRVVQKPSLTWRAAAVRYMAYLRDNNRLGTLRDYRQVLANEKELLHLHGRQVCDVLRTEIGEAVERVRLRGVKSHHKKTLVVCRRFFDWLSEDARQRETSVPKGFLDGAKAARPLNTAKRRVVNKGVPAALPIGRALAIARSGVLGAQPSSAIQLVLATVQRRRAVVGLLERDVQPHRGYQGEYVWFVPPAFRKTGDSMLSSQPHQVPLVGFAVGVVKDLERRLSSARRHIDGPIDEARQTQAAKAAVAAGLPEPEIVPWDWYFPVARPRSLGVPNQQPHMAESTLNHNMAAMPGVKNELSPHALRRAFASYGTRLKIFKNDAEAKIILDHTEGDAGNVTREHYDLDPRIEQKRELLLWWTGWLEEQCAAAMDADPLLRDPARRDELREACYRLRYGEDAWQRKLAKLRDKGGPLWPSDDIEENEAA
jgi:hypothetical protein